MNGLELATGMIRGTDPGIGALPPAPPGVGARDALETVVRRALTRDPCVVSFSGGRDSSAVLALATHVARREGLPDPVPVSQRFPGCEGADEDAWQEIVVRHLGLHNWVRISYDAEMDLVGPYAGEVLERCGLLWPPNAHFHLPVAEHARGGTVLTGFGGDELLAPGWLWHRVNLVLSGRVRWKRRDVLRVAAAYGPAALRRSAVRRKLDPEPRLWLTARAERAVTAAVLDDLVSEPVRWDVGVDRAWWRTRYRRAAEASLGRVAELRGGQVIHPLTDPVVLACVAAERGRAGFASRTEGMEYLVGDLLPPEVTNRSTKGALAGAFWSRHTREFVAGWDGSGLDEEYVDVDALRRMWTQSDSFPDGRTYCLLQAAWLASRSSTGPRATV